MHTALRRQRDHRNPVLYTSNILEKEISHQLKLENKMCSKSNTSLLYYIGKKKETLLWIYNDDTLHDLEETGSRHTTLANP